MQKSAAYCWNPTYASSQHGGRNTSIGTSKEMAAILLQQKRKAPTTHHSWRIFKDATTRREALDEEYVCTGTG